MEHTYTLQTTLLKMKTKKVNMKQTKPLQLKKIKQKIIKNEDNKNITNIEVPATQPQYKEETIATFSTKVYNKESARQIT